jgi:NAD(P)H-flavin reductase
MVPELCRVRSRVRETADTWTLELERPDAGEPPDFAPGQFNMLYAFGAGEVPISISGDPGDGGGLLHTVRAVGSATEAICASRPGDQLGFRGPYGRGWPVGGATGGDLVIVAGGLGLAPLRPAILEALRTRDLFGEVLVLYGGRDPEQLLYREELSAWEASPVLRLGVTVDSATAEWSGNVGVVTRLIERARFDPQRASALVCGPEVMMRLSVAALRDRGVAPDRIHLSVERNMKCAVTHCGRCVFGPTYVCRDGPVMRFDAVEDLLELREL